jgi:D-galactonate transporter
MKEFDPLFEKQTFRKITWRLIPFLFLCYILAYLDRVNVGFAKLQMQQDLGISDTVYGMGAGIFFIGYFLFEVPSNLIMQKVGAKFWIARIMIVWGFLSSSMMLTQSANMFYVFRFFLGVAEAGFFPGIILYLTFWYPRKYRAKMVAVFMTAIALSGVVGGPLSGWIMSSMSGVAGLKAWQWLFLLEGIPSVIIGIIVLFYLDNNPASARWLSSEEKELVLTRLQEEEELKKAEGESRHRISDAFRSKKVWLLCLVYFGFIVGNYGIGFWLPQIIKETLTRDVWLIGLISIIPWGIAAIAMVINGHHSDKTGERRWHIAMAGIVGAVAFALSGYPGISGVIGLVALTFAVSGVMSAISAFWTLPTSLLSGTAAAAGIAWINSVGNLGGYLGPFIIGHIRDSSNNMSLALGVLAVCCLISSLAVLVVTGMKRQVRND